MLACKRLGLACKRPGLSCKRPELRGLIRDLWMYRFPCILQDFVPFGTLGGSCPAYITATIEIYQSRASIPMTMSCLWVTGRALAPKGDKVL